MKAAFSLNSPLESIFWPNHYKLIINLLLMIMGSAFIAVAAQITIPWQPVPVTLQSFAVLFLGMIYGWRLGSASIILYILLGAFGVQVFSGFSGGVAILSGDTAGYIFGFLPAAAISGWLIQRGWGQSHLSTVCAGIIGMVIILLFGTIILSFYTGIKTAILVGMVPFLWIESLKLFMLSLLVPYFWKK